MIRRSEAPPEKSGFWTCKIQGFAWKSEILAAIFLQSAPIIWFSTIPRQAQLVDGINQ